MKFETPQDLQVIANLVNGILKGKNDILASGINEIHKVEKGDITFVDVPKYYKKSLDSAASIILINKDIDCPEGKSLIIVEDPFQAYNAIIRHLYFRYPMIRSFHDSVTIGENSLVENNVTIGENCTIGDNCLIRPNVTLYPNTIIGNNVIVHSGSVIGADAFYYKNRGTHYEKMISCGRVIIQDNVEIGANCTIDKGVSGDTIIGEGTKIDNQVHIAHGVVIGKHCLIAAQVGIAGKTIIGDYVKIWGQVGIKAAINIGDRAQIMAGAGVHEDLEAGKSYFGAPVKEMKEWLSDYKSLQRAIRQHKS